MLNKPGETMKPYMDVRDWEPWVKITASCAALIGIFAKWGRPAWQWVVDRSKTPSRVRRLTEILEREIASNGTPLHEKVTHIEEQTELANSRWIMIAEASPEPMYECDVKGECTFVNRALSELFGMPRKDMLGRGWLRAVISQEERHRVWTAWLKDAKQLIPYSDEYEIINQRTQKPLKVRTSTVVYKAKSGKVLGFHGLIRVIEVPES